MAFEITPVVVGSGLPAPGIPAEPVNTTTFGPEPSELPGALPGTPPQFLQWKYEGEPLGDNDVLIVDFLEPLVATRGVGEHENVITVRRRDTGITLALTGVGGPPGPDGATGAVGDLGLDCISSTGPFRLRDDWLGAAQSLNTYTHDINTDGAPNYSLFNSIATDGAGHAVFSPNVTATLSGYSLSYPVRFGYKVNEISDGVGFFFSLQTRIEGTVFGNIIELYFPFTESATFIALDWEVCLGKEVVIEYVEADTLSVVNVYVCGTLIGSMGTYRFGFDQMTPMEFFKIGRVFGATGNVYFDYLWLA